MTETIFAGVVVALVSTIAGAGISEIRGWVDYRRATVRSLAFSRIRTLDRLAKIRTAVEINVSSTVDNELWFLGAELDRYLTALSGLRDPKKLEDEWKTYETLQEIVIRRDLSQLDSAIARLTPRED